MVVKLFEIGPTGIIFDYTVFFSFLVCSVSGGLTTCACRYASYLGYRQVIIQRTRKGFLRNVAVFGVNDFRFDRRAIGTFGFVNSL